MDKFYIKSKKNSTLSNPTSSKVTTTSRTSSEIFQSSLNARRLGVGNICSKIRHKIEDNLTPKISAKLYKTRKHSKSMTALSSIGSSTGKYKLTNRDSTSSTGSQKVKPKSDVSDGKSNSACFSEIQNPYAECYNTSSFTKFPLLSYVDSDEDEGQLCLDIAKTSLEDEIFEELEKVAHDENKLNAVLKTFDKIIFDYNDAQIQTTPTLNTNEQCGVRNIEENDETKNSQIDNNEPNKKNCLNLGNDSALLKQQNDKSAAEKYKTFNSLPCSSKFYCRLPVLNSNLNECNKLVKSSSALSLTRRDSPCLRQMRHAFAKESKSKSVWELSNTTKIPILIPLKTRSKSFSYHNAKETTRTDSFESWRTQKALKTPILLVNNQENSLFSKRKKDKSIDEICATDGPVALAFPVKKRLVTKVPTNKTSTNIKPSPSKCSSSKSKRTTSATANANSSSFPHWHSSMSRRSKTSDELLDKCLEKGQQILRKVESINSQRNHISTNSKTSLVQTKSNSNKRISKDNLTLKRKQSLNNKLNYANQEKIIAPPLESCKIIPPVLGETSDKHAELLVQVTNKTHLTVSKQRVISEESQLSNKNNLTPELDSNAKNHEFDSDDSGHISNENMEIAINHTHSHSLSTASLCETSSASSSSATASVCDMSDSNGIITESLKMSEVLQKFERKTQTNKTAVSNSNENWNYSPDTLTSQSAKTNVPKTTDCSSQQPDVVDSSPKSSGNSRYCTTYKVAEVESVSVIRTHVEIFPNYTKEVTIRLQ